MQGNPDTRREEKRNTGKNEDELLGTVTRKKQQDLKATSGRTGKWMVGWCFTKEFRIPVVECFLPLQFKRFQTPFPRIDCTLTITAKKSLFLSS